MGLMKIESRAENGRADVILSCPDSDSRTLKGPQQEASSTYQDMDDCLHERSSRSRHLRVLVVDHDDSFTLNLVHMLEELGAEGRVVPARGAYLDAGAFDAVLLSPGPGNPTDPRDVGISSRVLERCSTLRLPVLGVCLGHQLLAHVHGGKVQRASAPRHGRESKVEVTEDSPHPSGSHLIFENIPRSFNVVRYHSLSVDHERLPTCLEPLAFCTEETGERTLMALRHTSLPQWGVQFHPESICTQYGLPLMANFLRLAEGLRAARQSKGLPAPPAAPTGQLQHAEAAEAAKAGEGGEAGEGEGEAGATATTRATTAATTTATTTGTVGTSSVSTGASSPPSSPATSARAEAGGKEAQFEKSANSPSLKFSWRKLGRALDQDQFFDLFTKMKGPRVLLESSRIIPGFSRFSFFSGAPLLGPLHYVVAHEKSSEKVVAQGPGAPFQTRSCKDSDSFFEILSGLLPGEAVSSDAPFEFAGGLVGHLGYELRSDYSVAGGSDDAQSTDLSESELRQQQQQQQQQRRKPGISVPDACYLFVDRFFAYDHLLNEVIVCSLDSEAAGGVTDQKPWALSDEPSRVVEGLLSQFRPLPEVEPPEEVRFSVEHDPEEYKQAVEECREYILRGESYELCLTTRFEAVATIDPLEVFRRLRCNNPAPYSFMFDFPEVPGSEAGFALLGSSPERFLSIDSSGVATSKPMKGTSRRDLTDPKRDETIRKELEQSEKDRAENLMIVDLVRHDLSTVCDVASVRCPQLMAVETYASVHQIVSLVRGQLSKSRQQHFGERTVKAIQACFPPGSMTGAPKLRSMELLHSLEHEKPRTAFSGAAGFLSVSGSADLAVVIRTLIVQRATQDEPGKVMLGAGGAVTLLSDAADEHSEMLLKAERLLQTMADYAPTQVEKERGAFYPVEASAQAAPQPERSSPQLLETMLWNVAGSAEEEEGGSTPSSCRFGDEPYLWSRHMERLRRSADHFKIDLPAEAELLRLCREAVERSRSSSATSTVVPQRLRLLVGGSDAPHAESAAVEVGIHFPMDLSNAPRPVALDLQPSVRRSDELLGHKTLWRSVYDQARGRVLGPTSKVFDVVMYNEQGQITETSIANIAVECTDGTWRTPPLSCGLLPGVLRAKLLDDGVIEEGTVTLYDLLAAACANRRIMCFNSVRGCYLVRLVNEEQQGLRA